MNRAFATAAAALAATIVLAFAATDEDVADVAREVGTEVEAVASELDI